MNNNDLYNILELNKNAQLIDIKKNFKRLALKYHPDKNKNTQSNINYNEKFNQIRIAYDILSNQQKKLKYDQMNSTSRQNFIDTLSQFLKKITDPHFVHNIMLRPDIIDAIKTGNVNNIAQGFIQKILDNIDLDVDIDKLEEVFIHTPVKNTTESNKLSTSDCNTLNIFGNICVDIEDVYHNRLKEIIIRRKIYKESEHVETETLKYNIPLYDSKVVILNAGDKLINNDNSIEYGNAIIKIKYNEIENIITNNYDIIYILDINLYELFYGFNKSITYFNTTIDICSNNPLQEYIFDSESIKINIKNKGLPFDKDNNRGNLIIKLLLTKNDDFEHKLNEHFNQS